MSIDVNCTAWKGFHTRRMASSGKCTEFYPEKLHPLHGDESFLSGVSPRTAKVWEKASVLITEEIKKGIIDVDTRYGIRASTTLPPAISTGKMK